MTRSHIRPARLLAALGISLTLVAAACGGDDDTSADEPTQGSDAGAEPTSGSGADGGDTPDASGASGGTLRVGYYTDVSSLDPVGGNAGSDHSVLWTMYDTLISFTPDELKPQPGLAESWKQPNPKTLTLNLRKNVTFHDGTPFDAEAVKFNIERAQGEKSNIQEDVASIETVEVVDPSTVTLHLSEPDTSLLLTLSDRAGMMVSPAAAQQGSLERNPVGAGPWRFVEWRRGSSIKVEKFADYWNPDVVGVDKINFTVLTDTNTQLNALRGDQVDMIFRVPAAEFEGLSNTEGIETSATPQLYTDMIYLNGQIEPFDDPRVREAINLAIDREAIVDTVLFGLGKPASTPIPKEHWAHADVEPYERDVERAKQLLADAGHPDGIGFQTLVYPDAVAVRRGEVLKSQLAEAGIDMELIPTELTQASSDFFNDKKFPTFISGWTGRPDPALTFRLMTSAGGYYNAGDIATEGLGAALDRANASSNLDKRAAALQEAAELVRNNSVYIPLDFPDALAAYQDRVQGFKMNLIGKPTYTGITLAD